MTLLVVVAHPDDETFACGSLLLHAGEVARTVVACASLGEAGEYAGTGEAPAGGLGGLRERELRAAADLLKVDQVEVLGFQDSGMSGPEPAGSICEVLFEVLVESVTRLLDKHRPTVVVTLDGSDGHRDHLRVRDAVVAAVDAAGSRTPVYQHCLPRTLMWQWLEQKAGVAEAAAYRDFPDIGTPDDDVTTLIDTSRYYGIRREAIALHASQSSPFDGLSEDLARGFLAMEHLRRVRPEWTGNEVEADLLGLERTRPGEGAAQGVH